MNGTSSELWDRWADLAFAHGFLHDMLPTIGKRPFTKNWTKTQATLDDIEKHKHSGRNIGIRASYLRFIDIDIPDDALSTQIVSTIRMRYEMPLRFRKGTGKCLLAFCMEGNFDKLSFKTDKGSVEFLANKQQAVVAGIHPDGTQYEWVDGIPSDFPILHPDRFNALWESLQAQFATDKIISKLQTPQERQLDPNAVDNLTDDVADWLRSENLIAREDEGRLHLLHCPWEREHTDQKTGVTQATYFVSKTNGIELGAYKCMHQHCANRDTQEFLNTIGYTASDFEDLSQNTKLDSNDKLFESEKTKSERFTPLPWDAFSSGPAPKWIVKGIIPRAELCVIYGASGSGKTFMALDLAFSIARGADWRGHKVTSGRVVYICAEGIGGFRNRLKAYGIQHAISAGVPLSVIPDSPNLLSKDDALAVAKSIGKASVVIIDTFAQVTAGGNENSGEDMGKALAHCKGIHVATGAIVILIHHAGKDETKGARGWSGIRAAADAEIEVFRTAQGNGARITKQKDGEDSEAWGFRLKPIVIGKDEDEDISSCYVEYLETAPKKAHEIKRTSGVKQRLFDSFDILGGGTQMFDTVVNRAAGGDPQGLNKSTRYTHKRALLQMLESGEFKGANGVVTLGDLTA